MISNAEEAMPDGGKLFGGFQTTPGAPKNSTRGGAKFVR
jgi:hypothetical protein